MAATRDEKGRFIKGVTPEGAKPITSEGMAKEYQARSVEARKANKTIAEQLRAYLDEDAGGGLTKGEALIRKAVHNHKDGKLTFRDLRDLTRILGEDTINIKTDGGINISVSSPEVAQALGDVLKKGAQPRNPDND